MSGFDARELSAIFGGGMVGALAPAGLDVTSEVVPALGAAGPGILEGGSRLAERLG